MIAEAYSVGNGLKLIELLVSPVVIELLDEMGRNHEKYGKYAVKILRLYGNK
jgi:hypothetical protein